MAVSAEYGRESYYFQSTQMLRRGVSDNCPRELTNMPDGSIQKFLTYSKNSPSKFRQVNLLIPNQSLLLTIPKIFTPYESFIVAVEARNGSQDVGLSLFLESGNVCNYSGVTNKCGVFGFSFLTILESPISLGIATDGSFNQIYKIPQQIMPYAMCRFLEAA